jgi:hypothetical protein
VISKIKLKKFQINLTLEFCLRLELINLINFFYSLGVTFFSFKFMISNFWNFFCCLHIFLNLHNFFHFFPNKNYQVKKN